MVSTRILQAIMGYIIPFALLIAALFLLEVFIELAAGLLFMMMNWITFGLFGMNLVQDTSVDFPGPLNLLNFAIGSFPSIWDIGTTLFFGLMEEVAFILYIIMTVVSGFLSWEAFIAMKNSLKDISDYAATKSGKSTRMTTYEKIVYVKDPEE